MGQMVNGPAMTTEQDDLAAAREIAHHARMGCHRGVKDELWLHTANCQDLAKAVAVGLAFARAAGEAAGIERAAKVADRDATRAAGLLATAKKRYAKRELLAAVGSQSDPDAECIHLEACEGTAKDIAAVIRSLSPQGGPDGQ